MSENQKESWSCVKTDLPVGAFCVGERLARQPEVALLESKARQQLGSLRLELVEVALLHRHRGQEHGPVRQLGACGGREPSACKQRGGAAINRVRRSENCLAFII